MARNRCLLLLATLCWMCMLTPSRAFEETCSANSGIQQGTLGASGYTSRYYLTNGAGFLYSEGVAIPSGAAGSYDITTLSVAIAPAVVNGVGCSPMGATPGSADIKLGVYLSDGATPPMYTLVASTNNIFLSASDAANGATVSGGLTSQYNIPSGNEYYVGFASSNPNLCIYGNGAFIEPGMPFTYNGMESLPLNFEAQGANTQFQVGLLICPVGDVVGDPVFRGFHGQRFVVKGEAGMVFNLLTTPDLTFNNRFVLLQSQNDSLSSDGMKIVRTQYKHSHMMTLVKGRPPVTTAWSHNGTYMGECGVTLGESKLYVAPGAYATGFASITLDGVVLPTTSTAMELDGDITVTHPSAYKVIIATRDVRFTIVNAEHFVNIEHVTLRSADAELTGLLGQTADAQWEVVESVAFKQHLENDFKVASNELF